MKIAAQAAAATSVACVDRVAGLRRATPRIYAPVTLLVHRKNIRLEVSRLSSRQMDRTAERNAEDAKDAKKQTPNRGISASSASSALTQPRYRNERWSR